MLLIFAAVEAAATLAWTPSVLVWTGILPGTLKTFRIIFSKTLCVFDV